jgi:hypothetical protein
MRSFKPRGTLGVLVAAMVPIGAVGCAQTATRFEIKSYRAPESVRDFAEVFGPGAYTTLADGNWTIGFEIPTQYVDLPATPTTRPDAEAPRADGEPGENSAFAGQVRMSQIILIDVFWRPQPGRTFVESSQTNANIIYCLTTGPNSITYEGAGFVSFAESRDGRSIVGRIESAALYPARFANAPADLFGPCRMTGQFEAQRDAAKIHSLRRDVRRRLGPPIGGQASVQAGPSP